MDDVESLEEFDEEELPEDPEETKLKESHDEKKCDESAKFDSLKIEASEDDKTDCTNEKIDTEAAIQENLKDLSLSNAQYRPFRDRDSMPSHYDTRSVSIASSSVPEAEIKKRVKLAFAKQQKAYAHRRLRKGEASLVNKKRRELREVVHSSKDLDFF